MCQQFRPCDSQQTAHQVSLPLVSLRPMATMSSQRERVPRCVAASYVKVCEPCEPNSGLGRVASIAAF